MALFRYEARSQDGRLIEAEMEAGSPDAVASLLQGTGATPLRIVPVNPASKPEGKGRELSWPRDKVGDEELIVLCRHMHRLVRAGIPLIRALTGLAESAENKALAQVLNDVTDGLRSGRQLSEALAEYPKVFGSLFVSVVRVGENTGQIEQAFEQIGHYLTLDRETRRRIKTATRYPMLVLGAIGAAMVLLNLFVIPAFADVFGALGADLPWATRVLIATSDFAVHYWPYLGVGLLGLVTGIRLYVASPDGRFRWDRAKLQIPVIGSILQRATLARFARSFAMTYTAGVPVIQTLQVVARAVGNDYATDRIFAMRSGLERGESFTRAAAACGLFKPMELQMMSVGEESGQLGDMYREIAEAYESEVEYDLRRMSDLIEPLLIIAIGGVVLVLALGIYLPMWDLAAAFKGR